MHCFKSLVRHNVESESVKDFINSAILNKDMDRFSSESLIRPVRFEQKSEQGKNLHKDLFMTQDL